jgi:tripartite-type tricarboxylate transporter receptor subunit TctC
MNILRIRPLLLAATLFGVALATATSAHAQAANWPAKPIRLIVPYPAGGNSDAIGRFIADRLSRALGQSFVVDNRAGAGATIGAEAAARAPADGYTFLLAPTAVFAITPHLRKVPYDPFADFVPVAQLSGSYSIATARKDAPFNNLKELAAVAGRQPGKLTYGSAGPATATHIAGEMLHHQAGVQLLHIPYKGSAEALNDLVAGRIDMIYDPVSLTQVKAGNVKAIAVLSKGRHPELPDVATVSEQGYPVDTRSWFGLFAPKGTPQAVVERTAAEASRIMAADETRQLLLKMSQYPDFVGPAAFAKQIREDSAAFKDLITRANIRGE